MMSEPLPTVKIASDHPDHGGFIVINKDDFDPKVHQLFEVAEGGPADIGQGGATGQGPRGAIPRDG